MATGQCYGCAATFGIFKKEHGCKNCGFSYCSKCVSKMIEVPKLNYVKHHVCNRCHQILTGMADREREKQEKERRAAPDIYYKRLAALQDRQPGGPHYNYGMHYSYNPASVKAIPPQYRGLSRIDADIAMRLDKLKENTKGYPKHTDREINDRLYRLKGARPNPAVTTTAAKKQYFYHPPERRPQQQQVDELLNEIADEVKIDDKFDPAKEVEERLVRFKDEPPRKVERKPATGNNLDSATSGPHKSYTKNISAVAGESRQNKEMNLDDVNTLIASMAKEMEVDAHKAIEDLQKDKEIMERLNEIKKKNKTTKDEGSEEDNEEQFDDSEDEEQTAKKIIKQYLEEVKLEERLGDIPSIDGQPIGAEAKAVNMEKPKKGTGKNKTADIKPPPDLDEEEFDPNELPYCCICTNDATIRCLGCDFDLYCTGCFKEAHDKFDMEDHVKVKYVPPKETSDDE